MPYTYEGMTKISFVEAIELFKGRQRGFSTIILTRPKQ